MKLTSLIIRVFIFAISSWILVHVFAVFGLFIAIAYPLFWWGTPNKTFPVLNKITKKIESPIKQLVVSEVLILAITALSILVVYAETVFLSNTFLNQTPKTARIISDSKGSYAVGKVFPMKVNISGMEVPVNAVKTDLSYDPTIAEVVSISTEGSFATIFVEQIIENDVGFARLSGGLPNPGYSGPEHLFATFYLKGISPGVFKVEFLQSSMVLANDGKGTNILQNTTPASFLITTPTGDEQIDDQLPTEKIPTSIEILGAETDSEEVVNALTIPQQDENIGVEIVEQPASTITRVVEMLVRANQMILSIY
jgi:hypothetical protein